MASMQSAAASTALVDTLWDVDQIHQRDAEAETDSTGSERAPIRQMSRSDRALHERSNVALEPLRPASHTSGSRAAAEVRRGQIRRHLTL
jgi:hypothetical protein